MEWLSWDRALLLSILNYEGISNKYLHCNFPSTLALNVTAKRSPTKRIDKGFIVKWHSLKVYVGNESIS